MTTYEPADWRPEPGDVAMVTEAAGDGPEVRCFLKDGWWMPLNGDGLQWNKIRHARRLLVVDPVSVVTLDPNDSGDLGALTRAMVDAVGHSLTFAVAEQVLRSLLPTPPLPEPNGLGAVVRGVVGPSKVECEWTRAIRHGGPAPWALSMPVLVDTERWWLWSAMRVTEVVSHGVGCTCGAPDCNRGDQ